MNNEELVCKLLKTGIKLEEAATYIVTLGTEEMLLMQSELNNTAKILQSIFNGKIKFIVCSKNIDFKKVRTHECVKVLGGHCWEKYANSTIRTCKHCGSPEIIIYDAAQSETGVLQ